MYGYGNYTTGLNMVNNSNVWTIVSFLVAICGGIIIYFTFLNPNNAKNYTGTTEKIYNFLTFKTMSLETILKICYLVLSLFITITSFSLISTSFVAFIVYLIVGNIIVRLIFEGALLIVMIYRKLNDINDKLAPKKKEDKKTTKANE